MKQQHILLLTLALLFSTISFCQNSYSCFQEDDNNKLKILICYDKNNKPLYVKYNGYEETFSLFYLKKEAFDTKDGHPRYLITLYYLEKYRGRVTGTFEFSNVGRGGINVTYRRKKDDKVFNFSLIPNTERNGSTPCF